MGNSQRKFKREATDEPEEELEQRIVSLDMPGYVIPMYEDPPKSKPVSNVMVPNLKFSKSVFILKKDTVTVDPIPPKFLISFEYDAEEKCCLCLKFGQVHKGLNNGVPSFTKPICETKETDLKVGKNVKFEMDYGLIAELKQVTLESCSFTTERKFVPILMVVRSKESEFKYYVMCGLKNDYANQWNIFVTKRRIQVGDLGYQVQEVYGLNQSEYNNVAEDKDERIKKCSICLDKPSNTILMPCRHLCLCSECSISLSVQIGRCPMCRACVTQILHINSVKTIRTCSQVGKRRKAQCVRHVK
nr:hypothetical protein MACL_00002909 [Theileria orientalis]